MVITVKLFAFLARFLPKDAYRNEARLTVEQGITVGDVIVLLGVPLEHCHLVLVDGIFIPREDRATRPLIKGEVIAIWPMVAGG